MFFNQQNSGEPMISDLQAIFFDLDNVLVFSERLHFRAWQQVMIILGASPDSIRFEEFVGIDDVTQSHMLKSKFSFKEEPLSIFELKRQTFVDLLATGFPSAQGRNKLLHTINDSFITAVVSSSSKSIVEQVLNIEKIDSFFDFVIAHEDCPFHKPHPYPYLMALEIAQVLPHQALVIEDSVAGIRAAQAAQIPVIGLLNDQAPEQILSNVTYFRHFDEVSLWLLNFINNQRDSGYAVSS